MSSALHRQTLADTVCTLKKHRDESWLYVMDNDEEYAKWAMRNVENLEDEVREALHFFLGE